MKLKSSRASEIINLMLESEIIELAEYEKLKRSIEQFGYVEPVIWNKTTGRGVGGHQRLKVLSLDCLAKIGDWGNSHLNSETYRAIIKSELR